jgi:hypothetical protein
MRQRMLVWDVPTRVFHWLLVVSFAGAFLTAESERYRDIHVLLVHPAWTDRGQDAVGLDRYPLCAIPFLPVQAERDSGLCTLTAQSQARTLCRA